MFTLMQGKKFMSDNNIIPSLLTVTAKLDRDIVQDLVSEQTKSIASLIEDQHEEKEETGQPHPIISG